jgi:hypothetical protein
MVTGPGVRAASTIETAVGGDPRWWPSTLCFVTSSAGIPSRITIVTRDLETMVITLVVAIVIAIG